MDNNSVFLVRVSCVTFNHALFIVDTMNGFAKQQTEFPYVCTIIDDASTDGEQEVIQEYLRSHFDLEDNSVSYVKEVDGSPIVFARHKTNSNCHFAVSFLKENHYSQGKSKAPYLADWLDTKYVAICEGDDYWTDPLKLQKQVDYLVAHPDCTLCFTNATMRWEDGSGKPDRLFTPTLEERDYRGPEITENWITPTASLVYRKEIIESDFYKAVISHPKLKFIGDIPLVLTCCHFGSIHALNCVTCVYRRQPNGFMLSADSSIKIKLGDYRYAIPCVFGKEYLDSSVNSALYHYRLGLGYAKKEHNWDNWFKLLGRIMTSYICHPIAAGKRILTIYREKKERRAQATY